MSIPVGLASLFKDMELVCRCGCGLLRLHRGFREELVGTRVEFDRSMIVASCCRCKAHNDRPAKEGGAGGHERSLHVGDFPGHADKGQEGTLAIDITCTDGPYRGALMALLWKRGWSIGIAGTFIHGDRRDWIGLPQTTYLYS